MYFFNQGDRLNANMRCIQWRGNYFWTGGQYRKCQIHGIFGPRFCPRNKRSLRKKGLRWIWTVFLSQKLVFSKKKVFADFRLHLFDSEYSSQGEGAQVAQGGQNISRGGAAPLPPHFPRLMLDFFFFLSSTSLTLCITSSERSFSSTLM